MKLIFFFFFLESSIQFVLIKLQSNILFSLTNFVLKKQGDYLGVAAKKRKLAKPKLPWTKIEEAEKRHYTLQWKRNPFAAAMR